MIRVVASNIAGEQRQQKSLVNISWAQNGEMLCPQTITYVDKCTLFMVCPIPLKNPRLHGYRPVQSRECSYSCGKELPLERQCSRIIFVCLLTKRPLMSYVYPDEEPHSGNLVIIVILSQARPCTPNSYIGFNPLTLAFEG